MCGVDNLGAAQGGSYYLVRIRYATFEAIKWYPILSGSRHTTHDK